MQRVSFRLIVWLSLEKAPELAEHTTDPRIKKKKKSHKVQNQGTNSSCFCSFLLLFSLPCNLFYLSFYFHLNENQRVLLPGKLPSEYTWHYSCWQGIIQVGRDTSTNTQMLHTCAAAAKQKKYTWTTCACRNWNVLGSSFWGCSDEVRKKCFKDRESNKRMLVLGVWLVEVWTWEKFLYHQSDVFSSAYPKKSFTKSEIITSMSSYRISLLYIQN